MANNRIYYPVHQVGIGSTAGSDFAALHGIQQYSTSTNFNLESVFQLGQLGIYANIEIAPEVEITLTKVLDGYPPVVTMATSGAITPELQDRVNAPCTVGASLFDDTISSTSGEVVRTVVESAGVFVDSINYSFPVDGNFTESVGMVGNDRIWKGDSKILNPTDISRAAALDFPGAFDGTDSPQGDSGVNRRQDILFDYDLVLWGLDSNGQVGDINATILPRDIQGISSIGTNEPAENGFSCHISNINISTELNLEGITELGSNVPFHRIPSFPVRVTTTIEATATSGDYISATEDGILTTDGACSSNQGNLDNNTIRIALCEGLRIYMGTKNKLESVSYAGGDAGGGNVSLSYTYVTANHMTIMHSNDPASFS